MASDWFKRWKRVEYYLRTGSSTNFLKPIVWLRFGRINIKIAVMREHARIGFSRRPFPTKPVAPVIRTPVPA
jgi:hypothetical protein